MTKHKDGENDCIRFPKQCPRKNKITRLKKSEKVKKVYSVSKTLYTVQKLWENLLKMASPFFMGGCGRSERGFNGDSCRVGC